MHVTVCMRTCALPAYEVRQVRWGGGGMLREVIKRPSTTTSKQLVPSKNLRFDRKFPDKRTFVFLIKVGHLYH